MGVAPASTFAFPFGVAKRFDWDVMSTLIKFLDPKSGDILLVQLLHKFIYPFLELIVEFLQLALLACCIPP